MIKPCIIFGCIVLASTFSNFAFSDFIVLNSNQVHYGWITEAAGKNDTKKISITKPGIRPNIQSFSHSDVKLVVRTIDQMRLRSLSVDRLVDYRNYAEELAAITMDTSARELAKRLCCLCIKHGVDRKETALAKSAGKILVSLARNKNERLEYSVAAFVFAEVKLEAPKSVRTFDSSLIELTKFIRREQFERATELLERIRGEQNVPEWMVNTLQSRRVSNTVKIKLLQIELHLENPRGQIPAANSPFELGLQFESVAKIVHSSIDRWSGFDLQKSGFRNGEWIVPRDKKSRSK